MRYLFAGCVLFLTGALSAPAAVDPALLALIPAGAKLVSGVQLDQARTSEFGRYVLDRIGTEDEDFQQFTDETGFDPRRDLDEFVFAASGSNTGSSQSNFVIVARGAFDQNRIEAKAKAKGAVVQTYQGVKFLIVPAHGAAIAFLEGGIAVMADRATLRQIIANRGAPAGLDPALQDQVLKISANNDAWFASSMGGSFLTRHMERETHEPMQHARALESILQSSGGVHFGDVVEFSFDATTRSPQDAVSLADVFRFGGSMIQMQRQNDPRAALVASAVDKMTVTNDGPALHATFSMPERTLEQLVGDAGPPTRAHPKPTNP